MNEALVCIIWIVCLVISILLKIKFFNEITVFDLLFFTAAAPVFAFTLIMYAFSQVTLWERK